MWELFLWKFPDIKPVKTTIIDDVVWDIINWKFWNNVVLMSNIKIINNSVLWIITEIEGQLIFIISKIIEEWISKYLKYKSQESSKKYLSENYKALLAKEVRRFYKEMQIKFYWIYATVNYLENQVDLQEEEFLNMAYDLLSPYVEVIFSHLLSNEDKINKKVLELEKRL